MKLVSCDNSSSSAPCALPAYLAIQVESEFVEDMQALTVLTPRVMIWEKGMWLLDLRPCRSYWQAKADQLGIDVIALIRMILQKQFTPKFDLDTADETTISRTVNKTVSETISIGKAAGYQAVLATDPWQAVLYLNFASERQTGGLVHLANSFGQALCKEITWKAWWKSVEMIGSHFEKIGRKRFLASVFKSQCEQMKRAVTRLGILSPWHLRHAESLAVGRRFGAVMKDLWKWTWDTQTIENIEESNPSIFSQFFASGFPWQAVVFEENPSVKRNLETPLLEWDHMAPLLREDLDRICDLDSWDSREKVVCLEWKVVTYDMICLNIRISFRHPHCLASERNDSFATTTLQAYYSFSEAVKDTADLGDGGLQNPPSPIVSWELIVSERLRLSDQIRDLFGVGQADSTALMDLENRLPIPLKSYDVRNDWLPEDSFHCTSKTGGEKNEESLQEDGRLDHISNKGLLSLCASACKRPLFLYKQPIFFDSKGGSSLWQFLERVMTKWWQISAKEPLLQRDYYKIIGHDKKSLWVFKDTQGGWYVHGIFA